MAEKKSKRQEIEDEGYYDEPARTGLINTILKANWGVYVFFIFVGIFVFAFSLYLSILLGNLLFTIPGAIILILSILSARAYGYPGDIITESCELIGPKALFFKYRDGSVRENRGDLYYDFSVGEDGVIPINKIDEYLTPKKAEEFRRLLQEYKVDLNDKTGGVMVFHHKSSLGRGASLILIAYVPGPLRKLDPVPLNFLVEPLQEKAVANWKKWPCFGGIAYDPVSTPSVLLFKIMKDLPPLAEALRGVVEADILQAENEALQMQLDELKDELAIFRKAKTDIRREKNANKLALGGPEEEGISQPWHQNPAIIGIASFISGSFFATLLMFVMGVL